MRGAVGARAGDPLARAARRAAAGRAVRRRDGNRSRAPAARPGRGSRRCGGAAAGRCGAWGRLGRWHRSILFRRLTGLADGLAPKERRYVRPARFAPMSWVPRFPPGGGGNSAVVVRGDPSSGSEPFTCVAPMLWRPAAERRGVRIAREDAEPLRAATCRRRRRRTRRRPARPRPGRCPRASCRCRAGGLSRPRPRRAPLGRLSASRFGPTLPSRWRPRACGSSRSAGRRSRRPCLLLLRQRRSSCRRRARRRCRGCRRGSAAGTATPTAT